MFSFEEPAYKEIKLKKFKKKKIKTKLFDQNARF